MKLLRMLLDRIRGEQNLKKLIRRGLQIGNNFKRMGGCIIDPSHCWHIEIGNNVTLAPRVHILAHDSSTFLLLGFTKIGNVKIGNNVFIGSSSTIMPGVTIGDDVIIGSGSVVTKDIPSNSVACGVPARVISTLQNYLEKEKSYIKKENCFSEEYTLRNDSLNSMHKKEMKDACHTYGKAFIK